MPSVNHRRTSTSRRREATQSNRQRLEPKKNESVADSPMHAERLRRLYAAMLKCRELDGAAGDEDAEASAHGLEAIISGAGIHLRQEDLVAPSPFEYLIRAIQGASRQASPSTSTQTDNPGGGTAPGSDQLHLAAGMALASKLLGKSSITLCLSKIMPEADFWRPAVSFAAKRKLPLVFILAQSRGNNQDAFTDLRNQAQELLPAITVDGNDVVAVYRVAEESTRRARQGLGPSLIECRLQRGRDALLFMENYLKARNLWSDSWKQGLLHNLQRELSSPQKSRRKAV